MAVQVDAATIHAEFKAEILHGQHEPGTPFREVSLAERFGVSRTPVREALGRLHQEGLLECDGEAALRGHARAHDHRPDAAAGHVSGRGPAVGTLRMQKRPDDHADDHEGPS